MSPYLHNSIPTLAASRPNRVKRLIADGQIPVGCLIGSDAPWLVEMLGMTGYDFVTYDLEHEAIDVGSVANLVRAADTVGMTSIVRMPASEAVVPMLTTGVQGVWVPDLRGRAHAEQIVEFTRHPPVGRRTFYTGRAGQYGVGFDYDRWTSAADAELLVVAMIEDIALVDELDEILAVDGIDGYHVGSADLAQSMGSPAPERVEEVVGEIVTRIREAGKLASAGVVVAGAMDGVRSRVAKGDDILTISLGHVLTHALGSFLEEVERQIPDERRIATARTLTPSPYVQR
ncbi:HpcH/HpaI aldolase/citrate lyase family protein [Kribbella sp. NPDC050124]|uniref:HpcH/HpaI aldolase/citrate lyase family protein n=1 Tax=Kribbella sp. NPDC050124 TaxID=3364114 RepID=UPI0037895D31